MALVPVTYRHPPAFAKRHMDQRLKSVTSLQAKVGPTNQDLAAPDCYENAGLAIRCEAKLKFGFRPISVPRSSPTSYCQQVSDTFGLALRFAWTFDSFDAHR
jgi:hypothetical protein